MAVQSKKSVRTNRGKDLVAPKRVADYLLTASRERGEVLTNLKLQKLLYYAQAWFLATNGKPLFQEDFEAWVHGPVLPSQYHRFKGHSWKPITAKVVRPELTRSVRKHLDAILDVFGSDSAIALERMTHAERPWKEARGDLAPHESSHATIDKRVMKEYYRSL